MVWLLTACAAAPREIPLRRVDVDLLVDAFGPSAAVWRADPTAVPTGTRYSVGASEVWLDPGFATAASEPAGCESLQLPSVMRSAGRWAPIPSPERARLDLVVDFHPEDETLSGTATFTAPRGPGPLWQIEHAGLQVTRCEVDQRPAPCVAGRTGLVVALPRGSARAPTSLTLGFEGSYARQRALRTAGDLGLLGWALPSAPELRAVELTITGLPPGRRWFGGRATDDGVTLTATPDRPDSWVLQGRTDGLEVHQAGVFRLLAPADTANAAGVLARAEATRAEGLALGLPEPPTTLLRSPHAYSFAGPPILLGDYALEETVWEHVVAHELGHHWYDSGAFGEAAAGWVATWVDDPDGTPVTAHYAPSVARGPRCRLIDPHARSRDLDTHAAALLLVALEDRIGRARVSDVLVGGGSWSDVLAALSEPDAAWLERWLEADRWPELVPAVTQDALSRVDVSGTGLAGEIEVRLDGPGAAQRAARAAFGPGAEPLALDGAEAVVLEPRARAPVVLARASFVR